MAGKPLKSLPRVGPVGNPLEGWISNVFGLSILLNATTTALEHQMYDLTSILAATITVSALIAIYACLAAEWRAGL
jgi:hypothetical protein